VTVTAVDTAGRAGQTTFTWSVAGRPSASAVALRVSRRTKAGLSFELSAGPYAAAIRGFALKAPSSAISFSGRRRSLSRGVSAFLSGRQRLRVAARFRPGTLSASLARTSRRFTVRLGWPELLISRRLAGQIAARHRPLLRLALAVTDSRGVTTTLLVAVRGLP
jgi:hypothetical protein